MSDELTPANKFTWAMLVFAVVGLVGYAVWKRANPPIPDLSGSTHVHAVIESGSDAPKPEDLKPIGRVTGFSLKDQNGATVDAKDLLGKVWVADFIFTHCAGTCPVMTHTMADLDKELAAYPGIQLISFSMDPENDTPQVLKKYAEQYEATSPRWKFLTGPKDELYRLTTKDFKLNVDDRNGTKEEPIIHSTKIVLVDAEGIIRGNFSSTGADGTGAQAVKVIAASARKLWYKAEFTFLATVNASLNALSFVFLMFGYAAIKRGAKETHRRWMSAAGITTLFFLTSYLTYHYLVGHVEFKGEGMIRYVYGIILFTHVCLAATIAVMIPITFRRAFKEQWESHKKIAKVTFPMWVYVSVTGVIVYLMVYHLYR